MSEEQINTHKISTRSGCLKVFLAIVAVFVITAAGLSLWVNYNVYARLFKPTHLNEKEQQTLETKMRRLEAFSNNDKSNTDNGKDLNRKNKVLEPEVYTEENKQHEIRISEKELNALIAKDEETAKRVAVDLSNNLVSILVLIPMDKDFPFIGGKTLRFNCGITLKYEAGKPVVAIRGVSIGGIPLPSSWWGNIKNLDLVQEFGKSGGFWDLFSKGVDNIEVKEGSFLIKLKE